MRTSRNMAVFDPAFPGASPFKVTRPEHGVPLLRALRSHARPNDTLVYFVIENRDDVAEMFVDAGATLRLETLRMTASLPLPRR